MNIDSCPVTLYLIWFNLIQGHQITSCALPSQLSPSLSTPFVSFYFASSTSCIRIYSFILLTELLCPLRTTCPAGYPRVHKGQEITKPLVKVLRRFTRLSSILPTSEPSYSSRSASWRYPLYFAFFETLWEGGRSPGGRLASWSLTSS